MLYFVLLLAPIGLILMLAGIKMWRQTVLIVLVWSVLEGAVRKWLFPEYQAPILQIKDMALIAAYAGCLFTQRPRPHPGDRSSLLSTLVLLQTIYCFVEIANPALPTPILGFYGFKLYVVYLPLVLVMPEIVTTRAQVQRMLLWICASAIPVGLLGLYQFTLSPAHWLNQYVSHEAGQETAVSLFGGGTGEGGDFRYGHARTSSTFSYIGGFTTYLLTALPFALATLLSTQRLNRATLIAVAALVISIGATFTTGSRTPVLVFAIIAPIMLLVAGTKGLIPLGLALRLTGMAAIAFGVSLVLFTNAATAFWFRAENSDSTTSRLLSPLVQTVDAFQQSPLFGLGVGANANVGASLVDPSLYWLNLLVELESARVMQELGLAGFLLFYLTKFCLIWLVIRALIWSRSRLYITVHVAVAAFLVPHVILFTVNNPTGGLFFWALGGFSLAAYRIERNERRAAALVPAAPYQSLRMAPPPQAAIA